MSTSASRRLRALPRSLVRPRPEETVPAAASTGRHGNRSARPRSREDGGRQRTVVADCELAATDLGHQDEMPLILDGGNRPSLKPRFFLDQGGSRPLQACDVNDDIPPATFFPPSSETLNGLTRVRATRRGHRAFPSGYLGRDLCSQAPRSSTCASDTLLLLHGIILDRTAWNRRLRHNASRTGASSLLGDQVYADLAQGRGHAAPHELSKTGAAAIEPLAVTARPPATARREPPLHPGNQRESRRRSTSNPSPSTTPR